MSFVLHIKVFQNIKIVNKSDSDIRFYPDREIDKVMTARLATCDYINDHLNVIVIGATGARKTFYISAVGNYACKKQSMLDISGYLICIMI